MARQDQNLVELLRRVVAKRLPSFAFRVSDLKSLDFSVSERRVICDVLLEEMVEFGLNEDSEPTDYGLKIEALIDLVSNLSNVNRSS